MRKTRRQTALWLLLLLLLLGELAGLLIQRAHLREKPLPSPPPSPLVTPSPAPPPSAAPSPSPAAPTASPRPERAPHRGYTEESYRLVSDLVYTYAAKGPEGMDTVREDLSRLAESDPALAELWENIVAYWDTVNRNPPPRPRRNPRGPAGGREPLRGGAGLSAPRRRFHGRRARRPL